MPGCNQALSGIAKDCGPNMGGIRAIFLNNFDNVVTPTVDSVSGKILAISLVQGADKFRKFELPKGVASLASSLQINAENGTNFLANTLTLAFNRMDTSKRVAVAALAVNDLCAIVLDNNGKYWFVGKDEPLTANGGDSGTGTAKADANRYGINLYSEELSYPYEINVIESGEGGVILSEIVEETAAA